MAKQPKNLKKKNEFFRTLVAITVACVFIASLIIQSIIFSPKNLFWAAIVSTLSTSSVTAQINQEQGSTQITQKTRTTQEKGLYAKSLVYIDQTLKNDLKAAVETENRLSSEKSISKYSKIETGGKDSESYREIENKWFSNSVSENERRENIASAFFLTPGYVSGTVPFVYLNSKEKNELEDLLKKTYKPDLPSAKFTSIDGKAVLEINTDVDPYYYLTLLNKIRLSLGFDSLTLNPEDYKKNQPLKLKFSIAKYSRQILSVTDQATSRTIDFSGHNIDIKPNFPNAYLTDKQVNKRLSQINRKR